MTGKTEIFNEKEKIWRQKIKEEFLGPCLRFLHFTAVFFWIFFALFFISSIVPRHHSSVRSHF